ncbi:MAG: NirD/YgiW/YdeI family stress tolerance protein [Spirochaetaceae bacterium]|nr:NirD/YgiW/YdeI family stress tolerance protein [Spirochaetaceae bacterium]
MGDVVDNAVLVTVQQALTLHDDAALSLKGNIIGHLGGESYTFKDATGTMEVEIDDEVWRGQQIGPDDPVLISGEVDRDWRRITIDVDRLVKQ